ncbi:MAG: DNA primase [Patescibacteria group bacterium]
MNTAVEQIKQRLDIVELLQEYLRLTKAGTNWKANCPFHHEKTPSFVVSPDKQIWHCFGCGKGGDAFTFIQEMEGVEFPEALRSLAQRANITLEQYKPEEQNHKTVLLDIVKQSQLFFSKTLQEDSAAKIARDYLQQRVVLPATQQQFGLGYSFNDWRKLYQHLQQVGYKENDLVAAGLIIQAEDKQSYYDRFRGRLMFPIFDHHGVMVGFTARVLEADATGGKYVNSPQSILYDKSRIIYGLNFAKQIIKKVNATIVVEGNMDVITAHQAGFTNTVAVSGTAFTEAQIQLLKRYSPNLLLAFDMDKAGLQAAQRSIAVALKYDMNVKVIQLPPEFKDPDECIKKDPAIFRTAIREAKHVLDFFFVSITKPLDLTQADHKKKAVQQLIPVLRIINDPVERSHYVQKLANLVQVDETIIQTKLNTVTTKKLANTNSTTANTIVPAQALVLPKNRSGLLAQQVLAIIISQPGTWEYAVQYLQPEFIQEANWQEVYKQMLIYYNNTGEFNLTAYLTVYPHQAELLHSLELLYADLTAIAAPDAVQRELIQGINELHKLDIKRRSQQLEWQLKQAEQEHDTDLINQLINTVTNLNNERSQLSKAH